MVRHFSNSVVSVSSSSFNGASFWYESLATIRNFPIAGRSSSGNRLRCGPSLCDISFHSVGCSKSKFNCSVHISTNPATNWRKQFLSFCLQCVCRNMKWNGTEQKMLQLKCCVESFVLLSLYRFVQWLCNVYTKVHNFIQLQIVVLVNAGTMPTVNKSVTLLIHGKRQPIVWHGCGERRVKTHWENERTNKLNLINSKP